MNKITIPVVVAIALSMGASATAEAKPRNKEQQEEINRQTVLLKKLEVADSKHVATAELGNVQAWLKEAERYAQRRRSRDEFRRTMDRVGAMVVLVEALLDESAAADEAQRAEQAAQAAEDKLAKLSTQADEVEARKAQLDGKVTR